MLAKMFHGDVDEVDDNNGFPVTKSDVLCHRKTEHVVVVVVSLAMSTTTLTTSHV